MLIRTPLRRVTGNSPCPICGKPDWCSVTDDGLVLCAREPEGARGQAANGAFIHVRARPHGERQRQVHIELPPPDLTAEVAAAIAATPDPWLDSLAARLGLPSSTGVAALRTLDVHRHPSQRNVSGWPMRRPTGSTTGIRYRTRTGKKFSRREGRDALFLPRDLAAADLLVVCEGATDTAAALALDFAAIGRPSATTGDRLVHEIVRKLGPRTVVLVAHRDHAGNNFIGQASAAHLAARLALICRDVRVVLPPSGSKDLRAAVAAGATRTDLVTLFAAAQPLEVCIA